MKVARNTIDRERGIDTTASTIVLRYFEGIISETDFMPPEIVLNVDANNCAKIEGVRVRDEEIELESVCVCVRRSYMGKEYSEC